MPISKFIPSKTNQWTYAKNGNIEMWISGYNTALISKKIIKYLNNKKYIEKDIIENILNSIDYHFGLVIFTKEWSLAATDCIRSYPLFWKKTDKYFLISPQANKIAKASKSKIENNQRLAFQMSGYTIGSSTLWKGINNINPGEYIIFKKNKIQLHKKYFFYTPWINNNEKFITLKKNLKNEIKKIILDLIVKANGRTIVIPLSAGLDSRLLASGLKEFNYSNVKCFSYGLKNNYESQASKILADKLGFSWKFVELNIKKSKQYLNSIDYEKFLDFTNDGCATPGIQDVYAIKILIEQGYIKKEDILVNGNSGDFISGGHIPKSAKNWKMTNNKKSIINEISDVHIKKHYCLWDKLYNPINTKIIKNELQKILNSIKIDDTKHNMIHGFLEYLEFENRQSKYVVNFQRVYDYYELNWLLPLWNKSFITFWSNVPLEFKIGQKLYRETLNEMNLGLVWGKEFEFEHRIQPYWAILIRFIFKIFFIFLGKNKWHKFDKRYFSYWTDNLCGQAILPYKTIITNNNGARHFVSWHTLKSEINNLKSNWQNIDI